MIMDFPANSNFSATNADFVGTTVTGVTNLVGKVLDKYTGALKVKRKDYRSKITAARAANKVRRNAQGRNMRGRFQAAKAYTKSPSLLRAVRGYKKYENHAAKFAVLDARRLAARNTASRHMANLDYLRRENPRFAAASAAFARRRLATANRHANKFRAKAHRQAIRANIGFSEPMRNTRAAYAQGPRRVARIDHALNLAPA